MKFSEAKTFEVRLGQTSYNVKSRKTTYRNNGALAIVLIVDNETMDPFGVLTVNLNSPSQTGNYAFIDVNNIPEETVEDIEKLGLIKPMDRWESSGYVTYPLYDLTELLKISYDED